MDAEFGQDVGGVGQHVHQVGDRGALVAGDIADAVFQQRLGDRQDALAAEFGAGAEAELLNFFGEGTFGHGDPFVLLDHAPGRGFDLPRVSDHDHQFGVRRQHRIRRVEPCRFGDRLGDQQAVERVAVMQRQIRDQGGGGGVHG